MLYSDKIHVCVCECACELACELTLTQRAALRDVLFYFIYLFACELRVLSRVGAGAGVRQWRAWGGGDSPAAEGGGGRSPVITGVVESSETAKIYWIRRQQKEVGSGDSVRTWRGQGGVER
jgi:hypothetical protein